MHRDDHTVYLHVGHAWVRPAVHHRLEQRAILHHRWVPPRVLPHNGGGRTAAWAVGRHDHGLVHGQYRLLHCAPAHGLAAGGCQGPAALGWPRG